MAGEPCQGGGGAGWEGRDLDRHRACRLWAVQLTLPALGQSTGFTLDSTLLLEKPVNVAAKKAFVHPRQGQKMAAPWAQPPGSMLW